MNAGSPGQDNSGEPTPAPDPWAQPGPPAQAAPAPSEPGGFVSPAPAAWSAPAEWTAPTPAPWPGSDDSPAQQPAGNNFSPADTDPRAAQPSAGPPTGQPAAPSAGQYGYPPPGHHGYPPAGQYGYQPYYAPAIPRTNRTAIAALVCGLVQFPLGLILLNILLAIPAIICGAIGLRQTRERGEAGRGMAIAGLVLGILGIAYFAIVLVLVIVVARAYRPVPGGP